MSLRKSLIAASLFSASLICAPIVTHAADYPHSIKSGDMAFAWSVDGDKLAAKVTGPTTGWVSVGFNPTSRMKDANIIIGYVKKGKVKIKDEYGTAGTQHKSDTKIGGTDDVTVIGGTEENGSTTIEFSIPLNSGDAKDGVIDPTADTKVILAYGPERDSFRLKHPRAYTVTVNLQTGTVK